jgi:hypothetical protein
MQNNSEKEMTDSKIEYNRILGLLHSLNKHAHYKAEFIIRWIREQSECLFNRHEFVFHPVIEGRVCFVCGRAEKEKSD